MKTLSRSLCTSFAAACAWSLPLCGLQIHDYDPVDHDRFLTGTFPSTPIVNEDQWANERIFSGVGWSVDDSKKGLALISPRHFVGANHYQPALGSAIRFLSMDGQIRTYTYARSYALENEKGETIDIFIGELEEAIPASHNIPFYPVLDRPESELIGRDLLVYGRGEKEPRIGRGNIAAFGNSFGAMPFGPLNDTRNYTFDYIESNGTTGDAYGEVGDSGSPSFIVVDGMMTVSGIHSAIQKITLPGTGTIISTYDSFILHYKDQIDDHLAKTGYRLTLAPVGDAGLKVKNLTKTGDTVTLDIHNPANIPYDVYRATHPRAATWERVATSRTGDTWTGQAPAEENSLFWKLIRYPLPVKQ